MVMAMMRLDFCRCSCSVLCLVWYLVLFGTGLILSIRRMDMARTMRGDSASSHALLRLQIQGQIDCFSKRGKWIYDPEPRYMVPNLFGSDNLRICEKEFLSNVLGGVAGDEANEIAARISAGNASVAEWKVREELKWEWQSDAEECHLAAVDREQFCRLIGPRRNVLVVGDSISQELYWTLLNYLVLNRSGWEMPGSVGDRNVQGEMELCSDVLGAGQGFRVGHIRNDRLSLTQQILEDGDANFYEFPWITFVEPWNISLFIFNRGAHFESDDMYSEALINALSLIHTRWPCAEVLYRSTPPGHPNCRQHQNPLLERDSMVELSNFHPSYHWAEFGRQNEIARNITERFGYMFLDLDAMISLRPDSHLHASDCLHYCMPGPLDVFAKLLFNALSVAEGPRRDWIRSNVGRRDACNRPRKKWM